MKEILITMGSADPININDMTLMDLSEITQYLFELCAEKYSILFEEKEND